MGLTILFSEYSLHIKGKIQIQVMYDALQSLKVKKRGKIIGVVKI